MMQPFTHDPSATGAFAALRSAVEQPAQVDAAQLELSMGRPIRAVVIGGGTGAPVSIRTLLSLGFETSAIVAMADDGGSTGIMRKEAGVTAPGDVRKCIAAMADDPNDPLTKAFKYRFAFARNHTLGNLMLSALEDAAGSFPEAIAICEQLLNARGHVYPSTLTPVTLDAVTRRGEQLHGQAVASHSGTALQRVWLRSEESSSIRPYQPALEAIRQADLIVLGPGSLFTSIIPNLLVPGVVDAIRESKGATVFVCGLADQQGETWGLTAYEHVQALLDHGMRGLLDYVLIHTLHPLRKEGAWNVSFANAANGLQKHSHGIANVSLASNESGLMGEVRPVVVAYDDVRAIQSQGMTVLARNLVDPVRPTWHNPAALQEAFMGVLRLCRSHRM